MSKYDYMKPTPEQVAKMEMLRMDFKLLDAKLVECLPDSRHKSLALTALEEAAMWTNKAVTHVNNFIGEKQNGISSDNNGHRDQEPEGSSDAASEHSDISSDQSQQPNGEPGEAGSLRTSD